MIPDIVSIADGIVEGVVDDSILLEQVVQDRGEVA
jgi:hypothetical protein